MTTTDVVARGLEVRDIKCVINYDFPGSMEDYVYHISHSGRAGAKGTVYTYFIAANARFARDLIKILEEAG
jgi:ATP-dependent RNA helicase DDX5/DBP2